MSAFWWGAYGHRHQALALASGRRATEPARPRRHGLRRAGDVLRPARNVAGAARAFAGRLPQPTSRAEMSAQLIRAGYARARSRLSQQAERSREHGQRDAAAQLALAPETRERLSAKRTQLARIANARADAAERGDARQVARLDHRAARVEREVAFAQQGLNAARRLTRTPGAEQLAQHTQLLDVQARIPASVDASARRRDYAALAGVAGYGREEYQTLAPAGQRVARMQIDRELAVRRELEPAAADVAAMSERVGLRAAARSRRALDRALQQRMGEARQRTPSQPADPIEAWVRAARARDRDEHPALPSSVMRDAREVAERRKRQLGRGRP
jgi:hypothetical protein